MTVAALEVSHRTGATQLLLGDFAVRRCAWCGGPVLDADVRVDGKTCGKRCRQEWWRYRDQLPADLRDQDLRDASRPPATPTRRVSPAALFVRADGPYPEILGADRCWDIRRDARGYAGTAPVVAHPPCARWGRFATLGGRTMGDDDGCFAAAVATVRRVGGVIEHPMASNAWPAFGLPIPGARDAAGGFTLLVRQTWWGHPCVKPTWLYVLGHQVGAPLPPFPAAERRPVRRLVDLSKRQRELTPPAFAAWLVELASACAIADRDASLSSSTTGRAELDATERP